MHKVSLPESKVIDLILRKNAITILSENGKRYNLEGTTAVNVRTIVLPSGNKTVFTIYCIESSSSPTLPRCRLTLTRNDTGPYTGELEFLDKRV